MTVRLYLTAVAFAWALPGGFGLALAQDQDPNSGSTEQLEGNVEPNSSAGANEATSDENASYLSGGGFDSEGNTSAGTDDGSDLQPHPFEATPNE